LHDGHCRACLGTVSHTGIELVARLRQSALVVHGHSIAVFRLAVAVDRQRNVNLEAIGGSEATLLMSDAKLAGQLDLLPVPLVEKHFFLVVSQGFFAARPDLAQSIWKHIEQVRNSPEYKKKLERETAIRALPGAAK